MIVPKLSDKERECLRACRKEPQSNGGWAPKTIGRLRKLGLIQQAWDLSDTRGDDWRNTVTTEGIQIIEHLSKKAK